MLTLTADTLTAIAAWATIAQTAIALAALYGLWRYVVHTKALRKASDAQLQDLIRRQEREREIVERTGNPYFGELTPWVKDSQPDPERMTVYNFQNIGHTVTDVTLSTDSKLRWSIKDGGTLGESFYNQFHVPVATIGGQDISIDFELSYRDLDHNPKVRHYRLLHLAGEEYPKVVEIPEEKKSLPTVPKTLLSRVRNLLTVNHKGE